MVAGILDGDYGDYKKTIHCILKTNQAYQILVLGLSVANDEQLYFILNNNNFIIIIIIIILWCVYNKIKKNIHHNNNNKIIKKKILQITNKQKTKKQKKKKKVVTLAFLTQIPLLQPFQLSNLQNNRCCCHTRTSFSCIPSGLDGHCKALPHRELSDQIHSLLELARQY